jgi:pyrroline-5-carboxylate reductase
MAGIGVEKIHQQTGVEKIVRLMPNTPILLGQGVCALYFTPQVKPTEKKRILSLLERSSLPVVLAEEEKIDLITPFSGSGPAYFFEWVRLLIEKMAQLGIAPELAAKVMVQTMAGAVTMLQKSGDSPEVLRQKVTSPGGVTAAALKVFEERGMAAIISEAMEKALIRTKELSQN